MNLNGLRAGSYIHPISYGSHGREDVDSHIFLQIKEIKENGDIVCSDGRSIPYRGYVPVSLTPKLYEALGFVKTDYSGIPNMSGVMWRKLLPNTIVDIYHDKTMLGITIPISHILSLHQWQNVHQDLTGYELKIDLKRIDF